MALLFLCLIFGTGRTQKIEAADTETDQAAAQDELLAELDFDAIQQEVDSLLSSQQFSFAGTVRSLLQDGDPFRTFRAGNAVLSCAKTAFLAQKGLMKELFLLVLAGAVLGSFSSLFEGKQVRDASFYMVYLLALALILKNFQSSGENLKAVITSLVAFMRILTPSYYLAAAAAGGASSAVMFYQMLLLVILAVEKLLLALVLPMIHIYLLIALVNDLSGEEILSHMTELLETCVNGLLKSSLGVLVGMQMIRNLIVKYVPCRILFLDTTHLAIIFSLTKEQTGSYHQLLTDALTQTGDMLYNYYSIRILASVGSLVENPRDLSASYSDARQIFPDVRQSDSAVIFADEDNPAREEHNVFNIAIFKDELQKAFNEYDPEALSAVFHDIIDLFSNDKRHYSQALSAASNVLHLTLSCLSNGEEQLNQIFGESANGYNCLYEAETVPQVLSWMTVLCDGLCRLFSEHNKDYKNRTISAVKKYINEHVDEKITLNQLSDVFNISPNYLSILFSKYNDMGFIDYVNHAKIECAKEMLDEGTLKIYEISDKLGYESAFYFSRVFKKVEGVSPRDYINRT